SKGPTLRALARSTNRQPATEALAHDVAVSRLAEEPRDRDGRDRPDAGRPEVLLARSHDRVELAELLGELARQRLPDPRDAERVKEASELGVLRALDRGHQVLRRKGSE